MGNSGSTEESVLPEVKNRCNDLVRHESEERDDDDQVTSGNDRYDS